MGGLWEFFNVKEELYLFPSEFGENNHWKVISNPTRARRKALVHCTNPTFFSTGSRRIWAEPKTGRIYVFASPEPLKLDISDNLWSIAGKVCPPHCKEIKKHSVDISLSKTFLKLDTFVRDCGKFSVSLKKGYFSKILFSPLPNNKYAKFKFSTCAPLLFL